MYLKVPCTTSFHSIVFNIYLWLSLWSSHCCPDWHTVYVQPMKWKGGGGGYECLSLVNNNLYTDILPVIDLRVCKDVQSSLRLCSQQVIGEHAQCFVLFDSQTQE